MCSYSEYGALPNWDVSNVTDMSNAFEEETTFNADISAWNVSSVTNMERNSKHYIPLYFRYKKTRTINAGF